MVYLSVWEAVVAKIYIEDILNIVKSESSNFYSPLHFFLEFDPYSEDWQNFLQQKPLVLVADKIIFI